MSEFYIRNKNAGFLGNSPTWYGKNGKGYTAYLTGAERFSEEKADKMVKEDPSKWEKFNCDHVDARLHLIFDDQDKHRLGTDEPCGWFKYADNPVLKEKVKRIANNALYFDDNSDYATALWEILTIMAPEMFVKDDEPELSYIEE